MATIVQDVLALVEAGTTPSPPPSGTLAFYAKTDGFFYMQTSAGVETKIGGGGSASAIPTYIPSGTTYTVPADTQMPIMLPVIVDGTLIIDGAMVSV